MSIVRRLQPMGEEGDQEKQLNGRYLGVVTQGILPQFAWRLVLSRDIFF